MTFTTRKVAALTAAAALAMSGATGVANAQVGSLPAGSLTTGSDLGSVEFVPPANATGEGSLDTSGSALIGEPTLGSLAGPVSGSVGSVNEAAGSNAVNPAPGTGSVDTTDSLIPGVSEPSSGSLVDIYVPLAGSLGTGAGFTTIVEGSLGAGGSLPGGSVGPVIMIGGSAAAIGAGIYFWPQIEQALNDAGIELPPLPGQPGPAPAQAPAPGPENPNGRG